MKTNLEHYKTFYTVAKLGNISDAAEELFISQPAVTKSIKNLEKSIGITLFHRSSRGVKLTDEGKLVFNYVEKALLNISDGEKIIEKLKNKEAGSIKIGISTTLCKYYLVPKLKNFITKYPKIEVRIINKSAQETINLLAEGDIDIGIVSNIVSHENFNLKKLDTIQDIFIASPELPNYENIKTLDDLKKLPSKIFLEKMNISRMYLDGFFKDNNVDVEPTIETSNMDLLVELTKINLGVGATIKEFIKDELDKKTLVELPIKPKIPPRFMIMLSNSKFPLSIAAQSFWDYLK